MNFLKQEEKGKIEKSFVFWRIAVCLCSRGRTMAVRITPLIKHFFPRVILITSRFSDENS